MNRGSLSAIASVAYKEFLHIYRDRRVLTLLLILPPVFTLVFGHYFLAHAATDHLVRPAATSAVFAFCAGSVPAWLASRIRRHPR